MEVLVIFLAALGVSQVLRRQEKVHWLQLELEYRRAGFDIPKPVPRLSKFEAWLNIAVGILLLLAGSSFVVMILKIPDLPGLRSVLPLASLILAGGATLAILGTRALIVHARVRSLVSR